MPLALVVLATMNVVTFYVFRSRTGGQFWTAAYADYYNGVFSLPFPPYLNMIGGVAQGSTTLSIVIGLGFLMMSLLYVPMNIMLCTRMVFAWSFDRILPAKFAEVEERTHSPIYAIAAVTTISIGFALI